ncbi:MAG: AAA family ATPase [Patescibacteria group bacterium]
MYLSSIEVQGFKSFAAKTRIQFIPPTGGRQGVTAIVGPNGSGKSNIADAIRWVLGEQSLKIIRGKKSEDVIFGGSDKKSRMGYAEVTLTLNNEDGTIKPAESDDDHPMDYSEIAITRRVYRDGEGEYLLNGSRVRLVDIQLLLARAHFAEKSYTVVGQGMIDHMLMATSAERKSFFDEAAGIKEFQIKRHQTVLKLNATRENLHESRMLLSEIEPRLQSLTRQVKRLEKRDEVESELHTAYIQYYGGQWVRIQEQLTRMSVERDHIAIEQKALQTAYDAAFAQLRTMEVHETKNDIYSQLQQEYDAVHRERTKLREEIIRLKNAIEVATVRATSQQKWAPLPLTKIITELEAIRDEVAHAQNERDLSILERFVKGVLGKVASLIERLQQPAPQQQPAAFVDTKAQAEIAELEKTLVLIEEKAIHLQERIASVSREEQEKKSAFFALQRELQDKQKQLHTTEQRASAIAVDLARIETRRDTLLEEIAREVPQYRAEIEAIPPEIARAVDVQALQQDVYRLRRQLELIGSIDPEVMKEYETTRERHEFLDAQVRDLDLAIAQLEKGIVELDAITTKRRTVAFAQINREFGRFFATLFNGGRAEIVEIRQTPKEQQANASEESGEPTDASAVDPTAETLVGIDIVASPPGKRVTDIAVLSGGEKALTSVALICAILSTNPSPFVVLDEVDAALDESNSVRFGAIIAELATQTQFVAITHNRATMEQAQLLYGVTMGEDGVSRVLSVRLEDAMARAAK